MELVSGKARYESLISDFKASSLNNYNWALKRRKNGSKERKIAETSLAQR